jgi:hypothetical protein
MAVFLLKQPHHMRRSPWPWKRMSFIQNWWLLERSRETTTTRHHPRRRAMTTLRTSFDASCTRFELDSLTVCLCGHCTSNPLHAGCQASWWTLLRPTAPGLVCHAVHFDCELTFDQPSPARCWCPQTPSPWMPPCPCMTRSTHGVAWHPNWWFLKTCRRNFARRPPKARSV